MYFIISLILFIAAIIFYHNGGEFDSFWKLLLASGLFGICDAINSCSLKSFIYTYKNMYNEYMQKKDSTRRKIRFA